ncbi:MAG: hypothetical protein FWC91_10990 [Defluviitaleaceae bacterium]|nr:hypothetical protein [Defluviitaleaceae bacterium]
MPTYAILQNPGHNRVYFKSSRALAQIEFKLAGEKMTATPINLREEIIGAVPYLLFDMESQLIEEDIALCSRLSFVYAIFEWSGNVLIPIEKKSSNYLESDDITTILKYNGKTNELFTHMLLNIAVFNTKFNVNDKLTILDPLCGKGTTLFDGLLDGHNVCGVDIDGKMIHEAYIFLKKYLETARYKHSTHQERQGFKDYTAMRYQIKLSRSKAEEATDVEFVAGDTRNIGGLYRKNTFNIIVGDLPYGVQHKSGSFLPILTEALPGWFKVLKPGGAMVLAWNLFLISKKDMESALEKAGFKLVMPANDESFVHRVDQAIKRDVIIGTKP